MFILSSPCPCSFTLIFLINFLNFPVEPQLFGVLAIKNKPQHSNVASTIVPRSTSYYNVDKIQSGLKRVMFSSDLSQIQVCVSVLRIHPPSGNLSSVEPHRCLGSAVDFVEDYVWNRSNACSAHLRNCYLKSVNIIQKAWKWKFSKKEKDRDLQFWSIFSPLTDA